MRALSAIAVSVDLIHTTTEVAEIAKIATKLGTTMRLEPAGEDRDRYYKAVFQRDELSWLSEDLALLVYTAAMVEDQTVEQVLAHVRDSLARQGVPADGRVRDLPGVGDIAAGPSSPAGD